MSSRHESPGDDRDRPHNRPPDHEIEQERKAPPRKKKRNPPQQRHPGASPGQAKQQEVCHEDP